MNKYEKYKFLKEELKAPRFENEDEEIEWFAVQFYGLYNQALRLRQENNRLLELCMYSLIRDTKIYNHELDDITKEKFIDTIKYNLSDDSYTLRKKIIDIWKEK